MKKNNKLILGIIIVCLLAVIAYSFYKEKIETNPTPHFNSNFIKLSDKNINQNLGYSHIITSYNQFMSEIGTNDLQESDFNAFNYAFFTIQYDSCREKDLTPVDYTIDGNNIKINFTYKAVCGGCAPYYDEYLLKVDKSITTANIDIDYKALNDPKCKPGVEYKPMIYLYPQEETNVEVKLGYPELLTTTYPKYKDSWKVLAKPDGKLIDTDGREYYGLYWEGKTAKNKKFNDGFVVKGKDSISFLEEKLFMLGLNEREANEFIVYWLPKLEKNKYNLIRFEEKTIIDKEMPLEISPKPDTIIRVLMKYKPLNKKINIKEQKLDTPTRAGFTVVEWGGTIVNNK